MLSIPATIKLAVPKSPKEIITSGLSLGIDFNYEKDYHQISSTFRLLRNYHCIILINTNFQKLVKNYQKNIFQHTISPKN